VIDSLLFLLGVLLCTRLIAACYGIIDLWYCWRQFWFRVFVKIAILVALIVAVGQLSAPSHQIAFLAGLIFFALFHVAIYWVGQLIRHLIERQM